MLRLILAYILITIIMAYASIYHEAPSLMTAVVDRSQEKLYCHWDVVLHTANESRWRKEVLHDNEVE